MRKEEKRLRVAVISSYPPQRCGIGYYTKDMIEALLAKHPELEFFILAERRSWIPYRVSVGRQIHEYRNWDRHSYRYPLNLFHSIQKIRPDIVLIQHEYGLYGSYGGYLLSLLIVLLRLFRFPIIMTMHTVCPRGRYLESLQKTMRLSMKSILWRWMDVTLTTFTVKKFVEKVIIHSEGLALQMIEDYGFPRHKIEAIPHGATILQYFDQKKAKDVLNLKNKKVILSFGFLSYRKGYENVIKAVSELAGKYKNLIYLIAGTNQSDSGLRYLKELKSLVKRLKMQEHVIFYTKQIQTEEIPLIFGASDVVILPYLELYGDSGVLRQAASFAKPVIASAVGTIMEEIENRVNGFIVPPANVELLKEEIEYLLNHPEEAEKIGFMLRNKAEREWDWKKVVERIYDVLMGSL